MPATSNPTGTTQAEPRTVVSPVCWEQYETVLRAFPEQAGLRIVYVEGRLTFLSPSGTHDWYAETIGTLISLVANTLDISWEPSGHATYRLEGVGAGVEGDKVYYLGPNAGLMRGPKEIDLSSQPPPDLVLEVEVTHPADDAVVAWSRIGVPEVWRFDARKKRLTFLSRARDGSYRPVARSRGLPPLEPADVLSQLEIVIQLGSSHWTAQLPGWVRGTLLPRLAEPPTDPG